MSDTKKVVDGLELCLEGLCNVCQYKNSNAPGGCRDELMLDALNLLKDVQYCKPVLKTAHAQGADDVWYECSKCGSMLCIICGRTKTCKKCGRAVKWE